MGDVDPESMMRLFTSWEVVSKANKWQGLNITRWSSQEYDQMYREAECELDPAKRAALFIAMNDLVIKERVVIPLLQRPDVAALNNKVRATLGPWEGPFWMLHEWYREA